jgi:hypothetical protein
VQSATGYQRHDEQHEELYRMASGVTEQIAQYTTHCMNGTLNEVTARSATVEG